MSKGEFVFKVQRQRGQGADRRKRKETEKTIESPVELKELSSSRKMRVSRKGTRRTGARTMIPPPSNRRRILLLLRPRYNSTIASLPSRPPNSSTTTPLRTQRRRRISWRTSPPWGSSSSSNSSSSTGSGRWRPPSRRNSNSTPRPQRPLPIRHSRSAGKSYPLFPSFSN